MDEGILAILGFWIVIILLIVRRPVSKLIERVGVTNTDVVRLDERCQKLESTLSTLSGEFIRISNEVEELRHSSDFSHKLLLKQQAGLVAASSAGSQAGKDNAPKPEDFGKITNEHTIRFERVLPGSKDKVWKYFTESDKLSQWLAEGKIETQFGGQIELNFAPGRNPGINAESPTQKESNRVKGLLSRAEEGKLLCYSWNDEVNGVESLVAVEFIQEGPNTKVVLTHSRLPQERIHHFLACWHTLLDTLAAKLQNLTPPDFNQRFREVIQVYIILAATLLTTAPAMAETSNTYKIVVSEKASLMKKYDNLWKDIDATQRELELVKRNSSDSDESQRAADQLDKQLKNQYRDIKELEYEIKDLDSALKSS
jgi:uncharacterized protein YndB with AHSA1/START domain